MSVNVYNHTTDTLENQNSVITDSALSKTSRNPVENRVVSNTIENSISDEWKSTVNYDVPGNSNNYPSYCIESNKLWKCKAANIGTRPSEDVSKNTWEDVSVTDEITSLNSNLVYSVSGEIVCGTYVDENGIKHKRYRKVVKTTTPLDTDPKSIKSIPFDFSQIAKVLSMSGVLYQASGYFQQLPCIDNNIEKLCKFYFSVNDNTLIVFNNNPNWNEQEVLLTVEYIKKN